MGSVVLSKYIIADIEEFKANLDWQEIVVAGEHILSLSIPLDVLILRATWNKNDERLFYFFEGKVLLSQQDTQYINNFPGLKLEQSVDNGVRINSTLTVDNNIIQSDYSQKCKVKDNDFQYVALPYDSRGNQSFAFGHFFSEVLPDLLIFNKYKILNKSIYKPLVFPLEEWSKEILSLFNLDKKNLIILPIITPLQRLPNYTSIESRIVFYQCHVRNRVASSLTRSVALSTHSDPNSSDLDLDIVILSRKNCIGSRPKRWIDLESCIHKYQMNNQKQTKCIEPSEMGPRKFHDEFKNQSKILFVAAPGSAIYNALYLTKAPVMVPVAHIQEPSIWSGQITDFLPYSHRLVFISRVVQNKSINWDEDFELEELPCARIMRTLFLYIKRLNCLFTNERQPERFTLQIGNFYINLPL